MSQPIYSLLEKFKSKMEEYTRVKIFYQFIETFTDNNFELNRKGIFLNNKRVWTLNVN